MTLAGLIVKNALRNKRRSVPTILSIAFSILLLTIMLTLWHSFFIDDLGPASALRYHYPDARYPELAARFNVRGIPNFVVLHRGRPVTQQAGLVDHNQMENWLRSAAPVSAA